VLCCLLEWLLFSRQAENGPPCITYWNCPFNGTIRHPTYHHHHRYRRRHSHGGGGVHNNLHHKVYAHQTYSEATQNVQAISIMVSINPPFLEISSCKLFLLICSLPAGEQDFSTSDIP
jgi:hypothetical protein